MATITYKCSICKRTIDILENKKGINTFSKCVITYGCKGKLLSQKRNIDNVRESIPPEVNGLQDYQKRNVLSSYNQELPSNIWLVKHYLNTIPALSVYVYINNILTELNPSNYTIVPIDSNQLKIVLNGTYTGEVQLVSRSSKKANPTYINPSASLTQITSNGYFVFAVPKYLTRFTYPPSILPEPTLPYELQTVPIRIEVNIKKPNLDEEICTEILQTTLSQTPWIGWPETLVRKRKNYYLFSKNILDFRTFGGDNLTAASIPDGTELRISRIDYGTGVLQPIDSEGLLIFLSNYPYTNNDKILNQVVDCSEIINSDNDFYVYKNGDFYTDQSNIKKTYPDIQRVISKTSSIS